MTAVLVLGMLLVMFIGTFAGAQEKVKLEFWHIWTGHRQAILREVLDRFEERYPWIEVEDVLLTSVQRVEKLSVGIAAGVLPDVAMIGFEDSIRWGRGGVLTPLKQFIEPEFGALENVIYPEVARGLLVDGDYYYLPHVMSIDTLLYANADLLNDAGLDPENLPQTIDDLLEAARKMTKRVDDRIVQIGKDIFKGPTSDWQKLSFERWLHILGGQLFDEHGNIHINSPEARRTLEWMIDFNDKVVGGPEALALFHSTNSRNTETNFENGRQGFLMWNDYIWGLLRGSHPDLNMVMGIAPYDPAVGPRTIAAPGWGYGIFDSPYPEEAWLLVRWLTLDEEGGLVFAMSQARATALPQGNLDPVYFDQHPYWHVIIESLNNAAPRNQGPVGLDITEPVLQMLNDAALQPRIGVVPALDEAQRIIEARISALD